MNSGLIIGDFSALNQGHVQMIEFALSKVNQLYVFLLGSQKDDHYTVNRLEWERNFPSTTHVQLRFSAASSVEEFLAGFDCPKEISILFSTDKQMQRIAKKLNLSFWLMERYQPQADHYHSVSRKDTFKYWHQMPRAIRQFFVKKVVLFGPESTGKSTLASQLADYFETVWNPEYIRGYLDVKQQIHGPFRANEDIVKVSDLEPVAIGQLISEKDKTEQANKLVFFDTNLLMHSLYVQHYFGQVPAWLQALVETQHYDLYLLMDTDIGFHHDPYRDSPFQQKKMHQFFRETLIEKGLPYFEISGTGEARFQNAVQKVKQFFNL